MTWHADTDLITAYATGELDDARAFSLEAHLLACPSCREACARVQPPGQLDVVWARIVDTLDRPRPRALERLLVRVGIGEHTARLVGATPSLQLSWLLAVTAALGFTVLAAIAGRAPQPGSEPLWFLILAPLIPVAGVAAAYGPGIDPTFEIGLAAPMRGFRLLLIRTIAVLCSSMLLIGGAAVALPGPAWAAAAWLLPAFALTSTTLILSTRVHHITAASVLGVLWVGGVLTIERVARAPLASFQTTGQLTFLLVGLLAVLVLAKRREAFEHERNG